MIEVEQRADEQLTDRQVRTSPYQGLLPYSEEDADYFCGRTAWTEIVTDHLLAYRVTLVYGPSGVGKSSLLRAGVVHGLLDGARENLAETGRPELLPAIVSGWSGNPAAGVEAALEEAATKLFGSLEAPTPTGSLGEIVSEWATRVGGRVLLVLDQFDEYFMYHESSPGGLAFIDTLSDLIPNREIPVDLLISIREDALAKLDRFDDPNVDLWHNLLRIDHLDSEAAREAIEEPLDRWNRRHAHEGSEITVEPALVDAVVAAAKPRAMRIGDAARGIVDAREPNPDEASVEAPYLQLVMTRLWEEERRRGSSVLRVETLNRRLGGAEQIVRRHFDGVMRKLPRRQRARAAEIMKYLVTPNGTKIALPPSALAKWSKQKEKKITPILTNLAGGEQRILRTVTSPGDPKGTTSYEIYHDRLADGILDWRSRYIRRRRRIRIGSAAFVVLAIGAVTAIGNRQEASNLSEKNEKLQSRVTFLEAQDATAAAAAKSPFFRTMLPPHSDTVYSVGITPDGRFVATGGLDDELIVADPRTGRQVESIRPALGGISRVVASPAGNAIALEGLEENGAILRGPAPRRRVTVSAPGLFNSIAFDGGNTVVTAGERGSASLWNSVTGSRQVFRPPGVKFTSDTAIVSPNGALVAAVANGSVRVWNVPGHTLLTTLSAGSSPTDILFSPNADFIAAVGRKRATVWTVGSWHAVNLPGPPRLIPTFDNGGSPDLSRLADFSKGRIVIAGARQAIVWSVRGKLLARLPDRSTTTIARFSPEGTIIATGTEHGDVRLWTSTGQRLASLLPGRGSAIESLAFSPDGRFLVSAGDDGTSTVWNVVPGPDPALVGGQASAMPDGKGVIVELIAVNRGLRRSPRMSLLLEAPGGVVLKMLVNPLPPGARRAVHAKLSGLRIKPSFIEARLIPGRAGSDAVPENDELKIPVAPVID